jgi:hypothetical protein
MGLDDRGITLIGDFQRHGDGTAGGRRRNTIIYAELPVRHSFGQNKGTGSRRPFSDEGEIPPRERGPWFRFDFAATLRQRCQSWIPPAGVCGVRCRTEALQSLFQDVPARARRGSTFITTPPSSKLCATAYHFRANAWTSCSFSQTASGSSSRSTGNTNFSEDEKPSLKVYADMVAADRELRLAGYEVFRFGANELVGVGAEARIRDFFDRLFRLHRVSQRG